MVALPRPLEAIIGYGRSVLGLREGRMWRPGWFTVKPTCDADLEGASLCVPGEGMWVCQNDGGYAWHFVGAAHDHDATYVNTLLPTDPNADRLYFWDDSAGSEAYLTPGNGMSISGATLNAAPAISVQSPIIASGAVTLDAINTSIATILLVVDTEAAAATDNLTTITDTGTITAGTALYIRTVTSARDVTVVHDGVAIFLAGAANCTLNDSTDVLHLVRRSAGIWVEVARNV